jgi:hypothetical protein
LTGANTRQVLQRILFESDELVSERDNAPFAVRHAGRRLPVDYCGHLGPDFSAFAKLLLKNAGAICTGQTNLR